MGSDGAEGGRMGSRSGHIPWRRKETGYPQIPFAEEDLSNEISGQSQGKVQKWEAEVDLHLATQEGEELPDNFVEQDLSSEPFQQTRRRN